MVGRQEPTNLELLGIRIRSTQPETPFQLLRSGLYVPNSGDMSAILEAEIANYNSVEYLRLSSSLLAYREGDPTDFNREIRKENRDPEEILRIYQIRHLVRILFQSTASWESGVVPHTRDIAKHCEWVQNTLCQADRTFIGEVPGDAWAFLWRMSYQQFKDMEGSRDVLRSLYIYRKLAMNVAQKYGFSVHDRFKEVTGLDLDVFWLLCMALNGWCIDNRGRDITLEVITRSRDFPGITTEMGLTFLELVGCDRQMYLQNLADPMTGRPGYEPYNLNPLLKWPLVKITEGAYLAPCPRDLLERASSGIYYDLMPVDQARFGGVLGEAFQEYVGLILTSLSGIPSIHPETRYTDAGTSRVTCDWVIVDGDTAVLIECKRSAIRAKAKITGDRELIRKDLEVEHGVVDGVLKLSETEQAIRNRCEGLELFNSVRNFYGIVVVLDDFYMPNSPFVRGIINEALEERGAVLEDRIQFSHVGGMEWLANLLSHSGTSIAQIIEEKTSIPALVEMDLKNFVPDYAARVLPGEQIVPWVTQFNDVYAEFITEAIPPMQVKQTGIEE